MIGTTKGDCEFQANQNLFVCGVCVCGVCLISSAECCCILDYVTLMSEPSGPKINDFNLISAGRHCAVWLIVQ